MPSKSTSNKLFPVQSESCYPLMCKVLVLCNDSEHSTSSFRDDFPSAQHLHNYQSSARQQSLPIFHFHHPFLLLSPLVAPEPHVGASSHSTSWRRRKKHGQTKPFVSRPTSFAYLPTSQAGEWRSSRFSAVSLLFVYAVATATGKLRRFDVSLLGGMTLVLSVWSRMVFATALMLCSLEMVGVGRLALLLLLGVSGIELK
ncbi:hypothetical protein IWX47DRAFT_60902 [Phyllosticta citricarpa]|uniref:Uncharacterized protein n=1 Tax=Phyllosticta citricarpa TaxID=55181 RepID=A0ABR1MQ86_9PEZI